jgi:hypothetical protein
MENWVRLRKDNSVCPQIKIIPFIWECQQVKEGKGMAHILRKSSLSPRFAG